jgi:zinc finger protein
MAFDCPHCGYRNNEIQSGGSVAPKGLKIECLIENEKDLSRQIVKHESASIKFKEIDFEIPANTQRGLLNTVEGFLLTAYEGLSQDQQYRKEEQPELFEKVEEVLSKLNALKELKQSFHVILDDPSGNSYIENLCAPEPDPKLKITHYRRTAEQSEALGLDPEKDKDADELVDHEGSSCMF